MIEPPQPPEDDNIHSKVQDRVLEGRTPKKGEMFADTQAFNLFCWVLMGSIAFRYKILGPPPPENKISIIVFGKNKHSGDQFVLKFFKTKTQFDDSKKAHEALVGSVHICKFVSSSDRSKTSLVKSTRLF